MILSYQTSQRVKKITVLIFAATLFHWCPTTIKPVVAQIEFETVYAPAPADNPLKGLVPYQNPEPERFPHSLEFNYIPFSKLMVGKDQFDWSAIESILNDVKSRGNQTVLRIFLEYPDRKNAIPKFLIAGGLKVHKYEIDESDPVQKIETPDYEDPNLRAALKQFIAAFGKKYDGDPRLGYLTAGLLGYWGEWHTYPREELWASQTTQQIVLDAYETAFKTTPVLLRYPVGKNDDGEAENWNRPFGYHDDSFAWATMHTGKEDDSWFFQTGLLKAKATEKWKQYPIGGEVRPEVWGCCHDEKPCNPDGQSFDTCRDAIHVTWLMESGLFEKESSPERKKRAIEDAQKMGYEFFLKAVSVDDTVSGQHEISVTVKNTGIAPFYHSGWKIQLGSNDTAEVVTTNWQLKNILPNQTKTYQTKVTFDASQGFSIRVPNPMKNGKPLRFANRQPVKTEKERSPKDGWLTLSRNKKG